LAEGWFRSFDDDKQKATLPQIGNIIKGVTPGSISFDIRVKNQKIGSIEVQAVQTNEAPYAQGIEGRFIAPVGRNLQQLASELANGNSNAYLTWLQIVRQDGNRPYRSDGRQVTTPYVDPPLNGYAGQWADSLPWYPTEKAPDNRNTAYKWSSRQLRTSNIGSGIISGTNLQTEFLKIGDAPSGKGSPVFDTFLVLDLGKSRQYVVLGGFTWSVVPDKQLDSRFLGGSFSQVSFNSSYENLLSQLGYTKVTL
jgi:hypothetical protein